MQNFIVTSICIASIISIAYFKSVKTNPEIQLTKYGNYLEVVDSDSKTIISYDKKTKQSFSIVEIKDETGITKYVAKSEHNCEAKTSITRYLAIYNNGNLIDEELDLQEVYEIESDSLAEIEFNYSCKFESV